uniref:Uncharacterized protein n=1 Tax=Anguilla anguilla TaxID=7936 RepID=A0A0E9TG78_ANGAN
MKTIDSSN